jgi:hypothetical protein
MATFAQVDRAISPQQLAIIEVLTSATIRRDQVGLIGSDEELLRRLNDGLDEEDIVLLAEIAKLLRLLDGILCGREGGEGFVDKFDERWRRLRNQLPQIDEAKECLDRFYERIQLYCASAAHREEEPLLFDTETLRTLAGPVYRDVKQRWSDRAVRGSAAAVK